MASRARLVAIITKPAFSQSDKKQRNRTTKMPRPRKSDPRENILRVRCSTAEIGTFDRCARAADLHVSTWARQALWEHAAQSAGIQGQLHEELARQHKVLLDIAAATSRNCAPADALLIMRRLADIETQLMTLPSRIECRRDQA